MTVNYDLYIEPEAHSVRQMLPGHIRQRLRRLIESLADEPRPRTSRALDRSSLALPQGIEIRRARIERWRVVYAVNDGDSWVWILAIRRRPPYDYQDLADLTGRLQP